MARGSRLAEDEDWRGEAVVKAERVHSAMMMLIRGFRTGTEVDHIIVNVRVGNTDSRNRWVTRKSMVDGLLHVFYTYKMSPEMVNHAVKLGLPLLCSHSLFLVVVHSNRLGRTC